MKKRFFIIGLIFVAGLLINSCKKYPENNLWFKNPGKVLARDYEGGAWVLEFYSVNNVDSTDQDFLKAYRDEGVFILKGNQNSYGYRSANVLAGTLSLLESKKSVVFRFSYYGFNANATPYGSQRNIFLDPNLTWKIKKLTKKSFWITTEFNNASYEIHFR